MVMKMHIQITSLGTDSVEMKCCCRSNSSWNRILILALRLHVWFTWFNCKMDAHQRQLYARNSWQCCSISNKQYKFRVYIFVWRRRWWHHNTCSMFANFVQCNTAAHIEQLLLVLHMKIGENLSKSMRCPFQVNMHIACVIECPIRIDRDKTCNNNDTNSAVDNSSHRIVHRKFKISDSHAIQSIVVSAIFQECSAFVCLQKIITAGNAWVPTNSLLRISSGNTKIHRFVCKRW